MTIKPTHLDETGALKILRQRVSLRHFFVIGQHVLIEHIDEYVYDASVHGLGCLEL